MEIFHFSLTTDSGVVECLLFVSWWSIAIAIVVIAGILLLRHSLK